jgi:hypothetical protein
MGWLTRRLMEHQVVSRRRFAQLSAGGCLAGAVADSWMAAEAGPKREDSAAEVQTHLILDAASVARENGR